jgi:hypothetical protein
LEIISLSYSIKLVRLKSIVQQKPEKSRLYDKIIWLYPEFIGCGTLIKQIDK